MADPVSLQSLLTYLTLISVPVGVVYHIMTLNNTRKTQQIQLETRQAQLFMQLYREYNTKEFMEDYANSSYLAEYEDLADWNRKYGVYTNLPGYTAWARVGRFFDGAGILVKKELIDMNLVSELLREPVIYAWENMRKWVIETRELMDTPEVWANFEYLYDEIRKIHPQTKDKDDVLSIMKEMADSGQPDP